MENIEKYLNQKKAMNFSTLLFDWLCISLELNKEDTSKLLNSAGYTLSASNDFDLTISYCIENNIYDFNIINNYLYTLTNTVL